MVYNIENELKYVNPELVALIHRIKEQGKLLVKNDEDVEGMKVYLAFVVSILSTVLTFTVPIELRSDIVESVKMAEETLRKALTYTVAS